MQCDVVFVAACCLLACAAARPAPAAKSGETLVPVLQYVHVTLPCAISFAAPAPRLAMSGNRGVVDIWNTRTWTRLRSFDANGGRLTPGDQVAAGAHTLHVEPTEM